MKTSSSLNEMVDMSDEDSICSQDTTCSSSGGSSMELPPEWEVAFADNNGRLYYTDNEKKETSWCPPQRSWKCCFHLPVGWEVAIDKQNFIYYINHNLKLTSYKHPNYENRQFEFLQQAFQARRRKVLITRNIADGFGFVAGSEKPVIIRSVVAGSPADGQLFANDQIFSIGGQIAYNLPQPQVISMIRSCTDVLEMEVVATEDIQDAKNQGTLKSALMSRATRERRKSCPVNVRFEEKPEVLHMPPPNALSVNIIKQMIPNVLKIFLENGQTKSFQYNAETTVKEIFDSIIERLQIKMPQYFALVLIGPYPNQTIFLQPEDRITQIVNKSVFSRWECRLELSFAPKNAFELLEKDPVAFEYWYQQTTNSVVKGHLGNEMKFDVIMRLAALQIHAVMTKENIESKFTIKDASKEYGGLDNFLPSELTSAVKKKEIRKSLSSQLKSLDRIARPGQKLTALQAKLHYLKIASECHRFGGKTFSATLISSQSGSDSSMDSVLDASDVLVSPSQGICTLFSGTGNVLQHLADFSQVTGIVITSHMLNRHHLKIFVKDTKAVSLILSPQDADDMSFLINGYHKIFSSNMEEVPIFNLSQTIPRFKAPADGHSKAPTYLGLHDVVPSTWSYIDEVVSTLWLGNSVVGEKDDPRCITVSVNLSSGPPKYGASKICDRSSFVPSQQRPAVDSFIRELSIRDKQKKHLKNLEKLKNGEIELKKVGQFDTTKFGIENRTVEDSSGVHSKKDAPLKQVINSSVSSDEDSSDEELSELAKKINRAGTVAKFVKRKEARDVSSHHETTENDEDENTEDANIHAAVNVLKVKMDTLDLKRNFRRQAEDEEDGSWRKMDDSDNSSTGGSLMRSWSSPWGTFSEEDSTDQESVTRPPDVDSLSSFSEEFYDERYNVVNKIIDEEKLEFSSKKGLNLTNRNSFDKYLVKNVSNTISDREKGHKETGMLSNDQNRTKFLLRPLSEISDEVFTEEENSTNSVDKSNCNTDDRNSAAELISSPSLTTKKESVSQLNINSSKETRATNRSSEDVPREDDDPPLSPEDRPKSVNLADLNIYIPGPPKVATKELDANDLRIPSPPEEFADDVMSDLSDDDEESTASISRGSSPEETIEFMHPIPALPTEINASDSSIRPSGCSSEATNTTSEIQTTVTEKLEIRRPDEDLLCDLRSSENEQSQLGLDAVVESGNENCLAQSDSENASTITSTSQSSGNESDAIKVFDNHKQRKVKEKRDGIRDISFRRETEPIILPLNLPMSPNVELQSDRVTSPLFFSVDDLPKVTSPLYHHSKSNSDTDIIYDHTDPFQQMMAKKSPNKAENLTLPNTPLAVRRNQFKEMGLMDNVQNNKFKSLPPSFSFEDYNVFIESCKMAMQKAASLEDQILELIEDNKQSKRQSFEVDDPEQRSYIDVMRTCSKSLANRTREVVTLATSGNFKQLGKIARASQSEVENLVVAMVTVNNSLTLASLIKDVVLEYRDLMALLKRCVSKPVTDPNVIQLIEKNNELTFALTLLIRALRSF